uniref:Uncharacterized protein n=1 Tax=Anopheles minimus TaxID=112268 RepID=A0A182WQF4_9DIPT
MKLISLVALCIVLFVAVSAAPYGPPKHYGQTHAVAHASAHASSHAVHHAPKVQIIPSHRVGSFTSFGGSHKKHGHGHGYGH